MQYKISDGVTQSMLGSWCNCRQAAAYRCEGWRPDRPKRATQLGSLVHLFMEELYRDGGCAPDVLPAMLRSIDVQWRALAMGAGDDMKEVERDLAILAALGPAYTEYTRKKDAAKIWEGTERLFDVRWQGYRLRGKVDGLFSMTVGKGKAKRRQLWLIEHKTKSRIRKDELNEALAFNWQNLFYIVAMQEVLGLRIDGVLYNIIRTPDYKEPDPAALRKRIATECAKEPEEWFLRYPTSYPEKVVVRFKDELLDKLMAFKQWVSSQNRLTYKNECACCARWTCDYLGACASGGCMAGYKQSETFTYSELEEA